MKFSESGRPYLNIWYRIPQHTTSLKLEKTKSGCQIFVAVEQTQIVCSVNRPDEVQHITHYTAQTYTVHSVKASKKPFSW